MRKTILLTTAMILLLGGAALSIKSSSQEAQKTSLTPTPEVFSPISEKEARSIAENSECVADGKLKDTATYNENSKTWWIDLEIEKPGCNPACVIYEDKSVEINWRCTGLIKD